jgi:hypothetical protein
VATATIERHLTAQEIRDEWQRTCRLPEGERLTARLALGERVAEKGEALFDRYGLPYLKSHPDKWIAIDDNGQVLIADTSLELNDLIGKSFEPGSYVKRRLNDARGHRIGL